MLMKAAGSTFFDYLPVKVSSSVGEVSGLFIGVGFNIEKEPCAVIVKNFDPKQLLRLHGNWNTRVTLDPFLHADGRRNPTARLDWIRQQYMRILAAKPCDADLPGTTDLGKNVDDLNAAIHECLQLKNQLRSNGLTAVQWQRLLAVGGDRETAAAFNHPAMLRFPRTDHGNTVIEC